MHSAFPGLFFTYFATRSLHVCVCERRDAASNSREFRAIDTRLTLLALVVRRMDNAIQWINLYAMDSEVPFVDTYL